MVTSARTWVEVSRSALTANVQSLQSLLAPQTTFCAVVKSNAYGHDLALTVGALIDIGVTHFAVDSLDEAHVIRRLSPNAIVFIMGMTMPQRLREAVAAQFVVNSVDEETLTALIAEAVAERKIALVNIEVETGLHRLGVTPRGLLDCARLISNNTRSIRLVGLSTHLSSAEDVTQQPVVDAQLARFTDAMTQLAAYHLTAPYTHAACSAAVILRPTSHFSMVRTGIALYGLWPSHDLRITVQRGRAFDLRPVLTWKTTVAQVKDVHAGGGVGYDRTFVAKRSMRIGVLPVGYWDGYDRHLSGRGVVLIRGRLCPVLGRICMNMCMVDVSDIPQVRAGDTAVLLGREGMHAVTADDIAEHIGSINYDVVTRINPLTPRVMV